MIKVLNKEILSKYMENCSYKKILEELSIDLFLIQYEKGELVKSSFQNEELIQIVVQGSLSIYFIRNDGTRYSLSSGTTDYLVGDMDLFRPYNSNIYVEACENLVCIAFYRDKNKDILLNNASFLRIISESLCSKIEILTKIDAEPTSLTERVISYMKYKCESGILKGIEQAAFQLNCSSRQLQRIMNKCEDEGKVKKIAKGTYQLLSIE